MAEPKTRVEQPYEEDAKGESDAGDGGQLEKTMSTATTRLSTAKVYVLFGAVFLSTFLMALNGSIIATVSRPPFDYPIAPVLILP